MADTPNTDAHAQEPGLKKTLGAWQLGLYGLGSMLGAGIYTLVGRAAGTLGNAIWIAFLLAMIAALLTGLSYANVGSRYARAGGAAYVTHRAMKMAWLSYVVGITVMMSGLTSMATGAQAIIGFIEQAMPLTAEGNVPELPEKTLAIGIVMLVGAIIYRGMRESMWVNIFCTLVEAAGLLFIIAVGIQYWGSVDYLATPGDSGGVSGSGITIALVMNASVLIFFSFIGFEDVLNVSEEVKNPSRDVPLGLIGAMLTATVIYMAVAITAVSVIPWQELKDLKGPLMEVAHRAAPWFTNIEKVYLFISIFAVANTALLNYIMGSRLLYGMSRQGLLPRVLGKVHPVRRTPHVAVGVLFLIVAVLIISGEVSQLAEATVLLLLTVFTVVNVALVILKRRPGEPRGGFEVPVFIPALGALVCASLIVARSYEGIMSTNVDKQRAPLIALAVIAISLTLYLVLRPKHVEDIGSEEDV